MKPINLTRQEAYILAFLICLACFSLMCLGALTGDAAAALRADRAEAAINARHEWSLRQMDRMNGKAVD